MTEQELANVIWDIKEVIRNSYDDSEVEDVILPFTLLRRLDCVLEDKYDSILEELNLSAENVRKYKLQALMKKNGITFFNMSGLSLKKLLNAPDHIGDSFKTYIEGFTDNVKDILANFVHEDGDSDVVDLSKIYSRLDRGNKLYAVIQQFVEKADLHPSKVSNAMMGTIFEIVIRRSKESTNTKAGQYNTPREVVKLLVSLTMCGKEQELFVPGKAFTIYDPCCGTGGMLTVGREHLQEMAQNKNLKVYLYGQELSEKTYAICKADLLMKGDDQNLDQQLFQGDTLADDKKNLILRDIAQVEGIDDRRSDHDFFQFLKDKKVKVTKAQQKLVRDTFGTINEDAPIAYVDPIKNDGEWVIDTNLNDTENIPMKQDIEEYFEREVLPFAPDAWMDRTKDKVGCEFPFTRLFYKYRPLRSSEDILAELASLDKEMESELESLKMEE